MAGWLRTLGMLEALKSQRLLSILGCAQKNGDAVYCKVALNTLYITLYISSTNPGQNVAYSQMA